MKATHLALAALLSLIGVDSARAGTQPIPISSCPFVITSPGKYAVVADLTCPGTDGIWIQASKVNLELMGHTIMGDETADKAGIRVESVSMATTVQQVSIKGPGLISSFESGVVTRNSANSSLKNMTVSKSKVSGIVVGHGAPVGSVHTDWELKDNVITRAGSSGYGMFLNKTTDSIVQGNDVSGNLQTGIYLLSSTDNEIRDNIVNGNGEESVVGNTGIALVDASHDNQVHSNIVNGNSYFGVFVNDGAHGNEIYNNQARGNAFVDMQDNNPACGTNEWSSNEFHVRSQVCID